MHTLKIFFNNTETLQLDFLTFQPDFPNLEILGKYAEEDHGGYCFVLSGPDNQEIQRSNLLDRDSFIDGKTMLGQFLEDHGDQLNADRLFQLTPDGESMYSTKRWPYWMFAIIVILSIGRVSYKIYHGVFDNRKHNNDSQGFIIVLNIIFLLFMLWGMWVFIIKRKRKVKNTTLDISN